MLRKGFFGLAFGLVALFALTVAVGTSSASRTSGGDNLSAHPSDVSARAPFTLTETPTPTPGIDLIPAFDGYLTSCDGQAVFYLTTMVNPPDAYVPVTTTIRFSSMYWGSQDFPVPPHQGYYTVTCTTGPCRAGGYMYTLTVDLYNDVQETNEQNNSFTRQISFVPCTPTPIPPTPIPTCGLAWRPVVPAYSDNQSSLMSVVALSSNSVWAGGYYYPNGQVPGRTLTMHWDGAQWAQVPSPNSYADTSIQGLGVIAPTDIWAVGYVGTVGGGQTLPFTMHWDGQQWTAVDAPSPGPIIVENSLFAVSGSASNDVWAVGTYTTSFGGAHFPLAMHWNGQQWSIVPCPGPGTNGQGYLYSIKAFAANDAWTVGTYATSNSSRALAMHWDGNAWTADTTLLWGGTLQGIDGTSASDIWAVGSTALPYIDMLILRHRNGGWEGTDYSAPGRLYAVSALSTSDVWAVGWDAGIRSVHWDGTFWTSVTAPYYGAAMYSIAAAAHNDVWATGPYYSGSYPPPVLHYTDPCVTPSPTPTHTTCPLQFSDVPPDSTFYPYIRCLACKGIVSGYSDGTFRPGNNVTRGQTAKIVSNAAGYSDDVTGRHTFEDVPNTNPFWLWIERVALHQVMSGYPCGGAGEPCCGARDCAYFRPFGNSTRAQLAKVVSLAGGFNETPPPDDQRHFEDVPSTNPFYQWVERAALHAVMGGYPCGGPGEPCGPRNLPYFRPYNSVTRGQASKMVTNTFYPGCQTPR